MVWLLGFEPGSLAPEAKSLDQTSRQPLNLYSVLTKLNGSDAILSTKPSNCEGRGIPLLASFGEYLTVDLQLRETTASLHILKVKHFLEYLGSDALDGRVCDIREYLNTLRKTPCDYKNALSVLKGFIGIT